MKFKLHQDWHIGTGELISLDLLYSKFPKKIRNILVDLFLEKEKVIQLIEEKKWDEIPEATKNAIILEFINHLNIIVEGIEDTTFELNDFWNSLLSFLTKHYWSDRFATKLSKDIVDHEEYQWSNSDTIRVLLSNIFNYKKPLPKKMWLVIENILLRNKEFSGNQIKDAISELREDYVKLKSAR